MSKKESFSNGQTVPHEIEKTFEKKISCNRDRHRTSSTSNLTNAEIYTNLENHDRTNNEVPTSSSNLMKHYYNSPSMNKEYSINSSSHFQDLNEKFQQLANTMFEVEKCFKEANRVDLVSEQQKSLSGSTSASQGRGSKNTSGKNLGEVQNQTVNVSETGNISDFATNTWVGNQNLNINHANNGFENEFVKTKYGSGDKISVHKSVANSSTKLSNGTCNTMIGTTEQSAFQFSNERPMKSYLTMVNGVPKFEMPESFYLEDNSKFTDVDLLENSKKLIVGLIDKELQKIEAKSNLLTSSDIDQISKITTDTNHRHLKMECIQNIEKELKMLKQLEESLEL